jgi:hypothetical protein
MPPNPIQECKNIKPFAFETKNAIENKSHECVAQPRDLNEDNIPHRSSMANIRSTKQ